MSGEGASRESLELPGRQEQLLEAVAATGKPVVLVLTNGRPLDIRWASQHVPAILEVWYPGTQGGNAIANLLFGDAVPGGKLPITWPRNAGQVPINYAHNTSQEPANQGKRYWDEESTPLYPFGYGLSYSTFSFSNLKVSQAEIKIGQTVEVTADVENTGASTADEVPQIYIHQQYGSASRAVRELKGFQRITLAAHEKKTVRFTLGSDELSYWSGAKKAWTEEPATFDVWVGADSKASLHGSFKIIQ
jgi:beta-glucosidase